MAQTQHTPGPWKVFLAKNGFHVIGIGVEKTGEGITDCGFGVWGGGDDESLANARLIAAAPDMLEALQGIEHFSDAIAFRTDTLSVELRKWIEAGRAALAKAKGSTNA